MFYDTFLRLCQEKGVTPTQVGRDIGIRQSTISMWKMQGTTPKSKTMALLAEYFGVSVNDLLYPDLTGQAQNFEPVTTEDLLEYSKSVYNSPLRAELMKKIKERRATDDEIAQFMELDKSTPDYLMKIHEFSRRYYSLSEEQQKMVSDLIDMLGKNTAHTDDDQE